MGKQADIFAAWCEAEKEKGLVYMSFWPLPSHTLSETEIEEYYEELNAINNALAEGNCEEVDFE